MTIYSVTCLLVSAMFLLSGCGKEKDKAHHDKPHEKHEHEADKAEHKAEHKADAKKHDEAKK